jgi:hypothetical protein
LEDLAHAVEFLNLQKFRDLFFVAKGTPNSALYVCSRWRPFDLLERRCAGEVAWTGAVEREANGAPGMICAIERIFGRYEATHTITFTSSDAALDATSSYYCLRIHNVQLVIHFEFHT